MDQRKLLELQTQRGAKTIGYDTATKTLEAVTVECRKTIENNSDKYRDMNIMDKREIIKQIIIDYVMATKPLVIGYIDGENRPDTLKLVDKLVEDITNYGVITSAMIDDSIFEIRCNGKELKVEQDGRIVDLLDKYGNIVSFESPEQQEIVMRKLLGDVRLTPKDAIVNARTIEGFRVAAIHNTALSPDPNNPTGDKYHAFVLRKFKKSKMGLDQIVKYGTMSDGMAQLTELFVYGGLAFATCGRTASGKTTTNNAILQSTPDGVRVLLIQNPSEIDLRKFDSSGRQTNDVLHLEATEKDKPTPSDPTMANQMAASLRLSPTMVCLGEVRTNKEFELCMMILNAGHEINVTYHAGNSEGAIQRFLTAYMASSGEGIETALPTLTSLMQFIVVQNIMKDGSRKVLQITEIIGVDEKNPNKAKLNDIYLFEPVGKPSYDEAGRVTKIPGIHKRVGKLSDKIINKLKLEGVPEEKYRKFTQEVSDTEVETYSGVWI